MICDPNVEHLEEIAERYNIENYTPNPKKAILDDDVNAVIIASPTKFHKEQVELAIGRNIPIYCEKPLTLTSQESQELADKVNNSNIPNQIGLVLRHSPSINFIKDLLESGEFGKTVLVNYRHDACFPFGGIYRGDWRKDRQISGGGILKEANVHDIDLLMYLFGDYEIEKCEMDGDEQNIETYLRMDLNFNDFKVFFNTFWHNIPRRGTSRRIEIFCENGFIFADDFMFNGPVTYKLKDQDYKTITRRELFYDYLEKKGIEKKKFKRFRQWYSSLANYAFYLSLKNNEKCEPSFDVGVKADKEVDKIYSKAGLVK